MRRIVAVFVLFACLQHAYAGFSVGFAREDVTPAPGIPMVGSFNPKPAQGTQDPLYLDCIAVSDGKRTALIFSSDELQPSPQFRNPMMKVLMKETGVPRDLIFYHATHTHTSVMSWPWSRMAPDVTKRVRDHAERRIRAFAEVGKRAMKDLRPARIFTATARCPDVSFIRRYRMKDGSVVTNPGMDNPKVAHALGEADDMVRVVRFMRKGAPDVAIVNFGTHPNTVSAQKYSADWPGVVRQTFENGIGGGVKCLFLNAAQGDVNHFCQKPTQAWWAMRRRGDTTKHIGRAVASAAMTVWDVCDEVKSGEIFGAIRNVRVPTHRASADELRWVRLYDEGRRREIPLNDFDLKLITGKNSRVRNDKNLPPYCWIPVSYLKLGPDIVFAGFACEPFVSIGRKIKEESPFAVTVLSCLTNGGCGYLASTESYAEGGYEIITSIYGAEAGDLVIKGVLNHLKELKKENRK